MKEYADTFGKGSLNAMFDAEQLAAECGLDRDEIEWRKEFVGFDEEDAARLAEMRPLFKENAEAIADDFYDNLSQSDQTLTIIEGSDKGLEQLKQTQSAYLVTLASGEYELDYFTNRARIGKLHDLLEMPMKHYIGQYGVYYDLILPLLFDQMKDRLVDDLTAAISESVEDFEPEAGDRPATTGTSERGHDQSKESEAGEHQETGGPATDGGEEAAVESADPETEQDEDDELDPAEQAAVERDEDGEDIDREGASDADGEEYESDGQTDAEVENEEVRNVDEEQINGQRTDQQEIGYYEPAEQWVDETDVSEVVAPVVEGHLDQGMERLLAVLRIINLDMQVVADTYIHSYSEELSETVAERERLMNEVEADVARPIEELLDSSTDIADSTNTITDMADDQAESVDDVAREVSDMSATVEEIAATAEDVAATSERAEALAREGRTAATEAIEVMQRVDDASRAVAEDVQSLQDRVSEIDDVVEVINDLAEQTNMLALNASIEAARAGEAGQGFAVVADEVKSLAEESQHHASDIERMVDEIQQETDRTVESLVETTAEVDEGIEAVEDAMQTLEEIVTAVAASSDGIQEVSAATDEQAASTEAVASMVDQLVEQADQVATEIDHVSEANDRQAARVQEIDRAVGQLTDD